MKASDYLKPEELRAFAARSDAMGAGLVLCNWLWIALIFALVATWTHPLSIVLAILALGGRLLGLSVLMHEAGHNSLFRTRVLNRIVGQWLAAYPVLGDCNAYGASHREHHRLAGTRDDPDLPNYEHYPIAAASFRRKLWRDLSGQTGLKMLAGAFRGTGNRIMMREGEATGSVSRGLIANAVLLSILWALGEPWLYLLWVAAYPHHLSPRRADSPGGGTRQCAGFVYIGPARQYPHHARQRSGTVFTVSERGELPHRAPSDAQCAGLEAAPPAQAAVRSRFLRTAPARRCRRLLGCAQAGRAGTRSR